ncbi:lantibiotic dehydratase [Nocardia sp. NPDC052566]|uniref:lantibiotic dehydratase n=1 Tax=Nocardia sp. NPDC052566 TaxID=3364330 RepID=UPI0037C9A2A6
MPGSNLYRALDWLMVRAPLLPVEEYLALGAAPDRPSETASRTMLPADPRVRRALTVGSGDLIRALEHPGADARARLAVKLQRYLIRMSSRPTPFGMFAGVGLAEWGTQTDLAIADAPPIVRTRPDMGWLLDFVATVEKRDEVRAGLRWFANPAAFVQADRVFLSERASIGDDAEPAQRAMSLRATTAVRRALECARTPVPYHDLLDRLTVELGADSERVAHLLDQLWEQTLLLTDLRPPLTAAAPARYVAQRLSSIPAAAADAAALNDLLERIDAWDALDHDQAAAAHPKLVVTAQSVHAAKTEKGPFQTDMGLPFAGTRVSRAIADEAERTAELLLRLTSWPTGLAHLDSYRNSFLERYGMDREVGLLELIDPEIGLGAPGERVTTAPDDSRRYLRDRTLTDLALTAIRDRTQVVELDAATIAKLEIQPIESAKVPTSLDISLFVVATSAAAVDAGDYQVVVGPNMGASVAGRVLGRFADVIGPRADAALRASADAEAAARPGRVWAEVSYLPRPNRLANVTIRPLARQWELAFDTTPSAPADRVLPLSELVVGVRDNRFVVRWSRTGEEVMPCAGHMLNSQMAPTALRFLDEIKGYGRPMPTTFDWGPATGFAFVPRIQVGRIVLSPARWRVSTDVLAPTSAASFADAFAAWRELWQPPRYVYLTVADNRLLLDLDAPDQVEQIRIAARGNSRGPLVLCEALPAPEQAWLAGPDGHYISEVVVPLVLSAVEDAPAAPSATSARLTRPTAADRLRPPGSDWLFAKLYNVPTFEEDLLANEIRTFCAQAVEDGSAQSWFFLRYNDPEPHLRIRWHGDPDLLADKLAPAVLRWGNALVTAGYCRRICLDTYDQEVERYGGVAATAVAEELFAADSVAVLDLLRLIDDRVVELDRPRLGMYTVHDLVVALGLDEAERADLFRTGVADRKATAEEYRKQKGEFRALLGDPEWLAGQPGGAAIAAVLAERRIRLRAAASRLQALAGSGELGRSLPELARSFVHMHCNRLLGCGHPPEQQVLGLLWRTGESLRHAPLR